MRPAAGAHPRARIWRPGHRLRVRGSVRGASRSQKRVCTAGCTVESVRFGAAEFALDRGLSTGLRMVMIASVVMVSVLPVVALAAGGSARCATCAAHVIIMPHMRDESATRYVTTCALKLKECWVA
eukprot:COSAG02_NODE_20692_length_819_cov_0.881944_2_plen_125_part_01